VSASRLICGLALACVPLATGCQFTLTKEPSIGNVMAVATFPYNMTRIASTQYREKCTINTEPPGCRIYCQGNFVGVSPVTIPLNAGVFELWSAAGGRKWFTEGGASDHVTWEIKAFKDGYQPARHVIKAGDEIGDPVFENAFKGTKDGWLFGLTEPPKEITGQRSVLLTLSSDPPLANPTASQPTRTAPSANDGTGSEGDLPGSMTVQSSVEWSRRRNPVDRAAKAEYEEALAAYKQALERRNMASLGQNSANVLNGMPDVNPKFKVLNSLGQQFVADDADKEVEVARQRLERAKSRMDHSEW